MKDFGTACIFFITFLVISFMRSGSLRTLILSCSTAVIGVFLILTFKPYIKDRFAVWGHVWEQMNELGYQQTRVLTYSASGGLLGVGAGNGYLKNIFAATGDLIFGMICEEFGLIIAVTVALILAGFAFFAHSQSNISRSTFYSISSCAAATMLVFQAALHIFGITDILPLTGVTLPFVSHGGSSMISSFALLAFIKAADERTYALKR
jgi:cell division protein FtsW (lipid II flippase)